MEVAAATVLPIAMLLIVARQTRRRPELDLARTLAILAVAMGAAGAVLTLVFAGPLGWGFVVSAVELNILATCVPPTHPDPGWGGGGDDGPDPDWPDLGPDAIDAEWAAFEPPITAPLR